jgi:hypothetical protein
MDETGFKAAATTDVAHLSTDADAVLAGVYRYHRRRGRQRLAAAGVGTLATIGLAVAAVISVSTDSTGNGGTESHDRAVVLTAYTVSANEQASAVATVDGVELTHLPPGTPTEPSVEGHEYLDANGNPVEGGTITQACFGDELCTAPGGMGVTVTRAPGLDLAGYLETNWVGNPTGTTVDGRPAVATGVTGDEAAGLVWSPKEGVVIEINVDSALARELRLVVDGIRVP